MIYFQNFISLNLNEFFNEEDFKLFSFQFFLIVFHIFYFFVNKLTFLKYISDFFYNRALFYLFIFIFLELYF